MVWDFVVLILFQSMWQIATKTTAVMRLICLYHTSCDILVMQIQNP